MSSNAERPVERIRLILDDRTAHVLRNTPSFVLKLARSIADPVKAEYRIEFEDGSTYAIDPIGKSNPEHLHFHTAEAIALMWKARGRQADALAQMRSLAEELVGKFAQTSAEPIQLQALELAPLDVRNGRYWPYANVAPSFDIRLGKLNGDLSPEFVGAHRVKRRGVLELVRWCGRYQADSLKQRAKAAAKGADGTIDLALLRAIEWSGRDVAETLREIAASGSGMHTVADVSDGTVKIMSAWVRGRATAYIFVGNEVRLAEDRVTLFGKSPPEIIRLAITGRGLAALVDHPVLSDAKIRRVTADVRNLHVDLSPAIRHFDRGTGHIL